MAFQSIWYFTNLPEEVVEIIEKDLSINFDGQMGDSKLHEVPQQRERNSQNAGFQQHIGWWIYVALY